MSRRFWALCGHRDRCQHFARLVLKRREKLAQFRSIRGQGIAISFGYASNWLTFGNGDNVKSSFPLKKRSKSLVSSNKFSFPLPRVAVTLIITTTEACRSVYFVWMFEHSYRLDTKKNPLKVKNRVAKPCKFASDWWSSFISRRSLIQFIFSLKSSSFRDNFRCHFFYLHFFHFYSIFDNDTYFNAKPYFFLLFWKERPEVCLK